MSLTPKIDKKYPRSIFLIIATEFCERFSFCGLRSFTKIIFVMSLTPKIDKYPRSIFLIIATEFCERFSFCGLRTILSLYLRNVLLFHENNSTVIYHVFIMVCYIVPFFGAVLADSYIGRFRTILYFSIVYAVGNVLMCLAAIPPLSIPPVSVTMIGMALIAIGTGGIKPCVAAFGGDQFSLPRQQLRLLQFFSIFYFTINSGGLGGMVVIPILRKSFTCFNDESCYALGLGFPALLMLLALFLFVVGKPLYKIKKPKDNIMMDVLKCACYAVVKKYRAGKSERRKHWLDYASEKYNQKLIADMKIVLAVIFLYIPLPLFWSLFDQQGSRWTFQASRMDGEVAGIHIYADQMQVLNPAIVLVLIPLFDMSLYPVMDRCCQYCPTALQKMVFGMFVAGLAFVASGVLELSLEKTYPILPGKGKAHLNFINTLPCDLEVLNPFDEVQTINSTKNYVFRNVSVETNGTYKMMVLAPYTCGNVTLEWPSIEFDYHVTEYKTDTIVVTHFGTKLHLHVAHPDDLKKSLHGKAKLRVVFLQGEDSSMTTGIRFTNYQREFSDTYYPSLKAMSVSHYMELEPASYNFSVYYEEMLNTIYDSQIVLLLGGVYTQVIVVEKESVIFTKMYVMTSPNSVHMMWLIPQYILISIAEVMFAISGLEFSFTQAPTSMKTFTVAMWYVSVAVGNMLVIFITQARLFRSQATEFFFFAGMIGLDMLVFIAMTWQYEYVRLEPDPSTIGQQTSDEAIPLLKPIPKDT